MKRKPTPNILFVTGTDTGVGKTVLTAMLLHNLRSRGHKVLAMKPFCSGDPADVNILRELQDNELSAEEINPYYFPNPVAPIASRAASQFNIRKAEVLQKIRAVAKKCDLLLVEGCGGLMVPITGKLILIDLIAALKCPVILVAANKLGVMNHTLLSVEALKNRGLERVFVTLMEQARADASSPGNMEILQRLLPHPVLKIPFLKGDLDKSSELRKQAPVLDELVTQVEWLNG